MATQQLRRAPGSSGLYDVLELILDRGLVIDAYVRVSLVGIELLTVDLRVVVASVDTYIRYAEAMERLGWHEREKSKSMGLPDMVGDSMTKHAVRRGSQRVSDALTGNGNSGQGNGHENGHGMTSRLASGAHAVAESTSNVLSRGAEKLKHVVSGEEEGERGEGRGGEFEPGGREKQSTPQGQVDQQSADEENPHPQQGASGHPTHGKDASHGQDPSGEHHGQDDGGEQQ